MQKASQRLSDEMSMKKIKVLMVAGDMHVGGIENQLMHLARNADKNKFQIDFTSTKRDAFFREEIEALGGTFILIPPMDWKNPERYCKALLEVMRRGQYDIVHSHELFHSGITLAIAKKAGIPNRFAHAHNWCDDDGTGRKRSVMRSIYNSIMRTMINRYSTIQIACSTWAGTFLYGSKVIQRDTYHLVFNSVDSRLFLVHYGQQESGEFCDSTWVNVLNVARITAVKNQKFLVEIADVFRKRGSNIRILCVGNGDESYEAELQMLIRERGLESYVRLIGVRKDIDVLMRKSSAFVLPSKYEGMPLVMIEAQASGLSCVSANTYSPEVDFEIDTVTWLSLDDSPEQWADAIEAAVQKNRPTKESVEQAIRKKKFDSKMFAETMCNLYQQEYNRNKKFN